MFGTIVSPTISVVSGYVPTLADVNGGSFADIVWINPEHGWAVMPGLLRRGTPWPVSPHRPLTTFTRAPPRSAQGHAI